MTFVSIAITSLPQPAAPGLLQHSVVHLLDRNDALDRAETAEDVFDARRLVLRRRPQEDSVRPLLDRQLDAGRPPARVADRLGQDDLALGRNPRFQARGYRHGPHLQRW